jgi:hypothetical protein
MVFTALVRQFAGLKNLTDAFISVENTVFRFERTILSGGVAAIGDVV